MRRAPSRRRSFVLAAGVNSALLFALAGCSSPDEADLEPAQETKAQALTRGDRLYWDEFLRGDRNESIRNGPGGRFQLTMQSNCDLVLRDTSFNRLLWSTRTAGRGSDCQATMDFGQLTIFRPITGGRNIVWRSNSASWGVYVQIDQFGDFAMFDAWDRAVWGGGTRVLQEKFLTHSPDRLQPGEGLLSSYDESIYASPMRLTMQHDCNLVLYDHSNSFQGVALWSSKTAGKGNHCFVEMQGTDGNLVIYDQPPGLGRRAVWHSGTHQPNHAGAWLRVQSDGNLVIYYGRDIWRTGTRAAVPNQQPGERHPGCRFSGREIKCGHLPSFPPGVTVCRDTFICSDPRLPMGRTEADMWEPCGICVGGSF
jgi:hypothetical protein